MGRFRAFLPSRRKQVGNRLEHRREDPDRPEPRKTSRVVWIVGGFLAVTLSLLYTTYRYRRLETTGLFPGNIFILGLVNINIILVVLLVLLLSRNLIKAYFERRHKIMGAGFKAKLVMAFVGFSAIPAILLFVVAGGFLNNSIDNWFSSQIEKSLRNSSEVAQMYYRSLEESTMRRAESIARDPVLGGGIHVQKGAALQEYLREQLDQARLGALEIFSESGRSIGRVSDSKLGLPGPIPDPSLVRRAIGGKPGADIRSTPIGDRIRCAVPIAGGGALVAEAYVPQPLVEKMEAVTRSAEEFRQSKAFKNPIKASYLMVFGSITAVILFSATWFGFYLARGITVPIQKLAEGTREVASGNLDFQIDAGSTDEIGTLVESFNIMTRDLRASKASAEEANRSLQASNIELEQRRAYIETVLENVGTGVLSIGVDRRIAAFNGSAERILNLSAADVRGRDVVESMESAGCGVVGHLAARALGLHEGRIEEQVRVELAKRPLTLRVNATSLRSSRGDVMGAVLVFEDLSDLIKAQKVAAWQEVARRIAHEIKNPLTPIQLSAQRLQKKYAERSEDFDKVFEESMNTIINEVTSLKRLVDEFSNFARMPAPKPAPNDLHDIVHEVVTLYRNAHRDIDITAAYDPNIPLANVDRDQIRRVFVNLFENAAEAMEQRGKIEVRTTFLKEDDVIRVEVADTGPGIDPDDLDKLFLPYFSRRKTGSGLGLAIVNRIVSDHNGRITVAPNEPRGSRFIVDLPVGI